MCGIAPGLFSCDKKLQRENNGAYKSAHEKKLARIKLFGVIRNRIKLRSDSAGEKPRTSDGALILFCELPETLFPANVFFIVLCDNIQRSVLYLDVGLGEILTDNTQCHQHHASKEKHEGKK